MGGGGTSSRGQRGREGSGKKDPSPWLAPLAAGMFPLACLSSRALHEVFVHLLGSVELFKKKPKAVLDNPWHCGGMCQGCAVPSVVILEVLATG